MASSRSRIRPPTRTGSSCRSTSRRSLADLPGLVAMLVHVSHQRRGVVHVGLRPLPALPIRAHVPLELDELVLHEIAVVAGHEVGIAGVARGDDGLTAGHRLGELKKREDQSPLISLSVLRAHP
jgi:hypothetical protein